MKHESKTGNEAGNEAGNKAGNKTDGKEETMDVGRDETLEGKTDKSNVGVMAGKLAVHGRMRRIMALVMLVLFAGLVINIMFFHVMMGETAILYIALVAVFFLGNGMRGGARHYDGQEPGESEESEQPVESEKSEKPAESGKPEKQFIRQQP
jgi:hypothetical protein